MIHFKKDVNYGSYGDWLKANEVKETQIKAQTQEKFEIMPKISIIVPMYETKEKFLKELIDSVIAQTYSNWELCFADGSPKQNPKWKKLMEKDNRIHYQFLNENQGISGNSNEAIQMVTGEYIALLDHDDLLAPYALFEVVKMLNRYPNAEFIYSDEDKIDQNGNRSERLFQARFCARYVTMPKLYLPF